jgi:predicted nucleic acid-binding protein
MSGIEPTSLFVDTGPFYARFDGDDSLHDQATELFERIRTGDLLYRPVYTSRYVLAETTRLLVQRVSHEAASTALSAIRSGELFTVLAVDEERFEAACEQFAHYDDQTITLVDHLSSVLAETHDATHVFTFDPDDFRTLGLTAVPDDTGDG